MLNTTARRSLSVVEWFSAQTIFWSSFQQNVSLYLMVASKGYALSAYHTRLRPGCIAVRFGVLIDGVVTAASP